MSYSDKTVEEDYSADFSPDNALYDLLPEEEKKGMAPPRPPKTSAAATTEGAPASEATNNQPGAQQTPAAADATGIQVAAGTGATEGQEGAVSAIVIAGEQSTGAAPAGTLSVTTQSSNDNGATSTAVTTDAAGGGSAESVIEIKPGMKLRTPDGREIDAGETINMEALRPRYDKLQAEKSKLEKENAEANALIEELRPWVDAATKDVILSNALTAIRNGADPTQAIRGAAIQAGKEQEFISAFQAPPSGPPKPGTPEYFRADFATLGIEEGSTEHQAWFTGHVVQEAKDGVQSEMKALRDELAAERKKQSDATLRQSQVSEETSREMTAIETANGDEFKKLDSVLFELTNIKAANLSPADQDRVATAITNKLIESGVRVDNPFVDPKTGDVTTANTGVRWLQVHAVREDSLYRAVAKAGIKRSEQPIQTTQVQVNGSAQNGQVAATNGHAKSVEQASLIAPIQSKLDLNPNRPHQPGPQSQGKIPQGGQREYNADRAFQGAFNDILPKD